MNRELSILIASSITTGLLVLIIIFLVFKLDKKIIDSNYYRERLASIGDLFGNDFLKKKCLTAIREMVRKSETYDQLEEVFKKCEKNTLCMAWQDEWKGWFSSKAYKLSCRDIDIANDALKDKVRNFVRENGNHVIFLEIITKDLLISERLLLSDSKRQIVKNKYEASFGDAKYLLKNYTSDSHVIETFLELQKLFEETYPRKEKKELATTS